MFSFTFNQCVCKCTGYTHTHTHTHTHTSLIIKHTLISYMYMHIIHTNHNSPHHIAIHKHSRNANTYYTLRQAEPMFVQACINIPHTAGTLFLAMQFNPPSQYRMNKEWPTSGPCMIHDKRDNLQQSMPCKARLCHSKNSRESIAGDHCTNTDKGQQCSTMYGGIIQ